MRKLIFTSIASCSLFIHANIYAQQTVVNDKVGHPSAVLDLSKTTGQGFLPPRVVLATSLSDATNPVITPAEGLIVYNEGVNQLKGYYIWNKGIWSLMATKDNSIGNAIYKQTSATNTITFSGTTLQDLTFINNQFVNTIPTFAYNNTNGQFTVPAGRYVIHLVMNVSTAETTTGTIGGKVHAHFYQGRLLTTGSTVLSTVNVNESSIATGAKSHMISINFPFEVTEATTFNVQLARRLGGTFNGAIEAKDSFIHIERSIL
ncbi:MAG: hypothetical protein EOO42_18375 [Flavobacteriales bacterium]|nr:MAG: hypothetical protein EOO42_18375 [Flavobacteriales bacterium]